MRMRLFGLPLALSVPVSGSPQPLYITFKDTSRVRAIFLELFR